MYHVDIKSSGSYSFNVKSKDYEFLVDLNGKGMTPPDVFLASIGTCLGVYLQKHAKAIKLDVPDFTISVEGDFAKENPICFRKINVSIDLNGAELDSQQQDSMMKFIKNCPIHNTIKNNPEIMVSIK